jgi:hypothetical protein
MNTSIIILALVFAMSAPANTEKQSNKAEQIVQRYLKLPYPEDGTLGKNRSERLATLDELKSIPNEAADVIARILPEVKAKQQRIELAEVLGTKLQTKKSAEILCGMLKDPNEDVRWQVIHSLRMLSRRTDRTSPSRKQVIPDPRSGAEKEKAARMALQQGISYTTRQMILPKDEKLQGSVEFEPKVEGLVPYLVSVANDPAERNRINVLYALADSRESLAVAEIRNALKDPSEKVRLYAACFLTEYQDASGLLEMQRVLSRLSTTEPGPVDEFDYYNQAEMIMASYERITGKSFGQIPMDPGLSSDTTTQGKIRKTYKALLNYWSQWLSWQPMPID